MIDKLRLPLELPRLIAIMLVTLLASNWAPRTARCETLDQRRTRLTQMEPEQKQQVLQNYERFRRMEPAEQQRLRALDADLTAAVDGDSLRKTMQRYHDWLNELPLGQRAEFLALPSEERLKKIAEFVRNSRARQERRVSDQDLEVVANWMREYQEQIGRFISLRRARGTDLPVLEPEDRVKLLAAMAKLRDSLSEDARQKLDRAESIDAKRQLVRGWITQAFRRNSPDGQPFFRRPSDEDLRHILMNELSEEQRKHLQSLTPEEMQHELWRRWMEKEGRNPQRDQGRDGQPSRGRPPRGREPFGDRRPFDRPAGEERPPQRSNDAPSASKPKEADAK